VVANQDFDATVAAFGVRALTDDGSGLCALLTEMGVLRTFAHDDDALRLLTAMDLPALRPSGRPLLLDDTHVFTLRSEIIPKFFQEMVYVFVRSEAVTGPLMSCTCEACLRYFSCEHIAFVQSLDVPTRKATRDWTELPEQRRVGRPKGSRLKRARVSGASVQSTQ